MADRERPRDMREDPVGYGRPPVAGQFEKGRSGNPKGRPKGSGKRRDGAAIPPSLDEIVLAESAREVALVDKTGKIERVPMKTAAVKAMVAKAARGNNPATRILLERLGAAERHTAATSPGGMSELEAGVALLTNALVLEEKVGPHFPAGLPRADEIAIDFARGEVRLRRPIGFEAEADWGGCWMLRRELAMERARLRGDLDDPRFTGLRVTIEALVTSLDRVSGMLDLILMARWHLTPADLAAPSRHVQPGLTWDYLRPKMSAPFRDLLDRG